MARIVCIGEGMPELSRKGSGWVLGYGGDTLNTAVHLSRAGHDVAYLTALGLDAFSNDLLRQWREEGLDTSLVLTHPTRQPGIYAITTDAAGERSFTYWRDQSAAREMFELPGIDDALLAAEHADLVYFSLITLAILPPEGRKKLLQCAQRARRRGGRVAFDSNYRASLWQSASDARAARDTAIACADIGLPTLSDEMLLSGELEADEVCRHWRASGCEETVVKLGSRGCMLPDGMILPPTRQLLPVDTTGAGDAFNGGYLAARLGGWPIDEAATLGQRLAARVIMQPGAIPDIPEWPGMLEQAP